MKLIDFYQTVSGTLEDFRAGRIGSKLAIEKIQYLNEKAAQHNLGVSIQDPDNILSHITIFDDERSYEDDRLLQRHGTNPKQSSKRDLLYRSSGGRSRPPNLQYLSGTKENLKNIYQQDIKKTR